MREDDIFKKNMHRMQVISEILIYEAFQFWKEQLERNFFRNRRALAGDDKKANRLLDLEENPGGFIVITPKLTEEDAAFLKSTASDVEKSEILERYYEEVEERLREHDIPVFSFGGSEEHPRHYVLSTEEMETLRSAGAFDEVEGLSDVEEKDESLGDVFTEKDMEEGESILEHYTVILDANKGKLPDGEEVKEESIVIGQEIELPEATREGYFFHFWNTSPDGHGQTVPNNFKPPCDMRLYAVYGKEPLKELEEELEEDIAHELGEEKETLKTTKHSLKGKDRKSHRGGLEIDYEKIYRQWNEEPTEEPVEAPEYPEKPPYEPLYTETRLDEHKEEEISPEDRTIEVFDEEDVLDSVTQEIKKPRSLKTRKERNNYGKGYGAKVTPNREALFPHAKKKKPEEEILIIEEEDIRRKPRVIIEYEEKDEVPPKPIIEEIIIKEPDEEEERHRHHRTRYEYIEEETPENDAEPFEEPVIEHRTGKEEKEREKTGDTEEDHEEERSREEDPDPANKQDRDDPFTYADEGKPERNEEPRPEKEKEDHEPARKQHETEPIDQDPVFREPFFEEPSENPKKPPVTPPYARSGLDKKDKPSKDGPKENEERLIHEELTKKGPEQGLKPPHTLKSKGERGNSGKGYGGNLTPDEEVVLPNGKPKEPAPGENPLPYEGIQEHGTINITEERRTPPDPGHDFGKIPKEQGIILDVRENSEGIRELESSPTPDMVAAPVPEADDPSHPSVIGDKHGKEGIAESLIREYVPKNLSDVTDALEKSDVPDIAGSIREFTPPGEEDFEGYRESKLNKTPEDLKGASLSRPEERFREKRIEKKDEKTEASSLEEKQGIKAKDKRLKKNTPGDRDKNTEGLRLEKESRKEEPKDIRPFDAPHPEEDGKNLPYTEVVFPESPDGSPSVGDKTLDIERSPLSSTPYEDKGFIPDEGLKAESASVSDPEKRVGDYTESKFTETLRESDEDIRRTAEPSDVLKDAVQSDDRTGCLPEADVKEANGLLRETDSDTLKTTGDTLKQGKTAETLKEQERVSSVEAEDIRVPHEEAEREYRSGFSTSIEDSDVLRGDDSEAISTGEADFPVDAEREPFSDSTEHKETQKPHGHADEARDPDTSFDLQQGKEPVSSDTFKEPDIISRMDESGLLEVGDAAEVPKNAGISEDPISVSGKNKQGKPVKISTGAAFTLGKAIDKLKGVLKKEETPESALAEMIAAERKAERRKEERFREAKNKSKGAVKGVVTGTAATPVIRDPERTFEDQRLFEERTREDVIRRENLRFQEQETSRASQARDDVFRQEAVPNKIQTEHRIKTGEEPLREDVHPNLRQPEPEAIPASRVYGNTPKSVDQAYGTGEGEGIRVNGTPYPGDVKTGSTELKTGEGIHYSESPSLKPEAQDYAKNTTLQAEGVHVSHTPYEEIKTSDIPPIRQGESGIKERIDFSPVHSDNGRYTPDAGIHLTDTADTPAFGGYGKGTEDTGHKTYGSGFTQDKKWESGRYQEATGRTYDNQPHTNEFRINQGAGQQGEEYAKNNLNKSAWSETADYTRNQSTAWKRDLDERQDSTLQQRQDAYDAERRHIEQNLENGGINQSAESAYEEITRDQAYRDAAIEQERARKEAENLRDLARESTGSSVDRGIHASSVDKGLQDTSTNKGLNEGAYPNTPLDSAYTDSSSASFGTSSEGYSDHLNAKTYDNTAFNREINDYNSAINHLQQQYREEEVSYGTKIADESYATGGSSVDTFSSSSGSVHERNMREYSTDSSSARYEPEDRASSSNTAQSGSTSPNAGGQQSGNSTRTAYENQQAATQAFHATGTAGASAAAASASIAGAGVNSGGLNVDFDILSGGRSAKQHDGQAIALTHATTGQSAAGVPFIQQMRTASDTMKSVDALLLFGNRTRESHIANQITSTVSQENLNLMNQIIVNRGGVAMDFKSADPRIIKQSIDTYQQFLTDNKMSFMTRAGNTIIAKNPELDKFYHNRPQTYFGRKVGRLDEFIHGEGKTKGVMFSKKGYETSLQYATTNARSQAKAVGVALTDAQASDFIKNIGDKKVRDTITAKTAGDLRRRNNLRMLVLRSIRSVSKDDPTMQAVDQTIHAVQSTTHIYNTTINLRSIQLTKKAKNNFRAMKKSSDKLGKMIDRGVSGDAHAFKRASSRLRKSALKQSKLDKKAEAARVRVDKFNSGNDPLNRLRNRIRGKAEGGIKAIGKGAGRGLKALGGKVGKFGRSAGRLLDSKITLKLAGTPRLRAAYNATKALGRTTFRTATFGFKTTGAITGKIGRGITAVIGKVAAFVDKITMFFHAAMAKIAMATLGFVINYCIITIKVAVLCAPFVLIITFFTGENERYYGTDPERVEETTMRLVYDALVKYEAQWGENLKKIIETDPHFFPPQISMFRYTIYDEDAQMVDWEHVDMSEEEYLNYLGWEWYKLPTPLINEILNLADAKAYHDEAGDEWIAGVAGPTPFNGAPEEAYKIIKILDGGVLIRALGVGGDKYRTSNLRDIVSMASVAQQQSERPFEEQYGETDDEALESGEFFSVIRNRISKVLSALKSLWRIITNWIDSVKDRILNHLADLIPPLGNWLSDNASKKRAQMYMTYCKPLFDQSHRATFELCEPVILPTKRDPNYNPEIDVCSSSESQIVYEDGLYEEHDGYGCMHYDGFAFNDTYEDLYYNGEHMPHVHPRSLVGEEEFDDIDIPGGDYRDTCVVLSDSDFDFVVRESYGWDCWDYVLTGYRHCNGDDPWQFPAGTQVSVLNQLGYTVISAGPHTTTVKVCTGIHYHYPSTVPCYQYQFYTFTHNCQSDHVGYYCGGHIKLKVNGLVYGFTEAEIANLEEEYTPIPYEGKIENGMLYVKSWVPAFMGTFYNKFISAFEKNVDDEEEGTFVYPENVTATYSRVQFYDDKGERSLVSYERVKIARDIFDIDMAIMHLRGSVHKDFNGWLADYINDATTKIYDDWKEHYGIEPMTTLAGFPQDGHEITAGKWHTNDLWEEHGGEGGEGTGGGGTGGGSAALTGTIGAGGGSHAGESVGAGVRNSLGMYGNIYSDAEINSIITSIKAKYGNLPDWARREQVLRTALSWCGKLGYNQGNHTSSLKVGGNSDCSGFVSQVLGIPPATTTTLFHAYAHNSWGTNGGPKPGDIIISGFNADGTMIKSSSGAPQGHALIYAGNGYYIDCTKINKKGGVYYRQRGDNYSGSCVYIPVQ